MPIYLKIPDYAGDSTSKVCPNQFTLASINWGVGTPTQLTSNGLRAGAPSFSQISVQKVSQIQSPNLMFALAQGKNLGTVVITSTTSVGNSIEVATEVITLTNAILTDYQQTLEPGVPGSENLSFAFTRIDYGVFTYNNDGSVKKSDDHFWDLTTNKGG